MTVGPLELFRQPLISEAPGGLFVHDDLQVAVGLWTLGHPQVPVDFRPSVVTGPKMISDTQEVFVPTIVSGPQRAHEISELSGRLCNHGNQCGLNGVWFIGGLGALSNLWVPIDLDPKWDTLWAPNGP